MLYLQPPKPKHISSIHTDLYAIDLTATSIVIKWQVVVKLKNESIDRHTRQVRQATIDARVFEESNALRWDIYLRPYGFPQRKHFVVADQNNTLDPPITNNQSYRYEIDSLQPGVAYEFCIKSVNSGVIQQSEPLQKRFPVTAHTDLTGRTNPMFVCKEVITPRHSEQFPDAEEVEFIETRHNRTFTGRSFKHSDSTIKISDDATDQFVLYTAITSGATTVFVFIIVLVFCCCRCGKRKEQQSYLYRQGTPHPEVFAHR